MADTIRFEEQSLEEEQIITMVHQECSLYSHNSNCIGPEMYSIWRRKICEWSYNVVDHFHFDREVVSLSLYYLDQFIALEQKKVEKRDQMNEHLDSGGYLPKKMDGKSFQLTATTALYMAIKIHGEHVDGIVTRGPQRLSIKSFVNLSRGHFTIEDIESTEMKLLTSLTWKVNPPTAQKFTAFFLRLLPTHLQCTSHIDEHGAFTGYENELNEPRVSYLVDERVVHVLHELSRYLTEVSVYDYALSTLYKPSVVAFATILISVNLIDSIALPLMTRDVFFSRIQQLTSLHPKSNDVVEAMAQVNDICPDITACDDDTASYDSKDHPIAIAREAGFLATNTPSPEKRYSKQEHTQIYSPCTIATNHLGKPTYPIA